MANPAYPRWRDWRKYVGENGEKYIDTNTGPLAGLNEDQIENLLLRAVLADLSSRVGPGFDLEQEQVRARREIEAGDRLAPPLDHGFLEDIEELL